MEQKTTSICTLAKLVCKCIIYTHRGQKTPFNKKTQNKLDVCSTETRMNKEGLKKLAEVAFLLLSHMCLLKATIKNKQELCHVTTSTSVESYA